MPPEPKYQRQVALSQIRQASWSLSSWRAKLELRVGYAVSLGISLREVGRAAGVDASTVKRIAERQK